MLVIHIAFECAPIYKTGGLADVVGSLPRALLAEGAESALILPKYSWIKPLPQLPGTQIPIFYINSPFFTTDLLYYQPQLQARAFADFALKIPAKIKEWQLHPQIIHSHDWHAALVPFLLLKQPDAYFNHTKTVLTIHNIAFQGKFATRFLKDKSEVVNLLNYIDPRFKQVSYLKLGIETADWITTVSNYHASEIKTGKAGFGLQKAIKTKKGRFTGILNGIDYGYWNPRHDESIKVNFNRRDVIGAKLKNKLWLQNKLGLEQSRDIPLFGFIARLTSQKGLDILIPFIKSISRHRIQVVILGSGRRKFEQQLQALKLSVDSRWYSVNIAYNEQLAHQIYAGSDFFLVPSAYEPCGLTQMITMAYGSIPVVTAVGGLKDTVVDGKTGIYLKDFSVAGLIEAVEAATSIWENSQSYQQMVDRVMRQDFSWKKSAKIYLKLYNKLLRLPR